MPDPLVEGLLNRGNTMILAGHSGVGKTPLLSQLATCVTAEVPFLGMRTRHCRVGIIDVETSPSDYFPLLDRQWRALGLDEKQQRQVEQSVDLFQLGDRGNSNSRDLEVAMGSKWKERWHWVQRVARERQWGMVVVDTTLTFSPFKASDEETARDLFRILNDLKYADGGRAVVLSQHLRKTDRRAPPPALETNPHEWFQELLGSVVWTSGADVRLGLGGPDGEGRVVVGGFRRGHGALAPRIVDAQIEEAPDGRGEASLWRLCPSAEVAKKILTDKQRETLSKIPVGRALGWRELVQCTGAPKVSLHRLLQRARGQLIEYNEESRTYLRTG